MQHRRASHGFAVLFLCVAVVGLLMPLPNQYRSPWVAKLLDLAHVPVFALVAVCLWWLLGRKLWLAFGLAALVAVAAEIGQGFTGRSSDPLDVVRGVLGALIGALFTQVASQPFQWRRLVFHLALAIALAAWPVWDCGPVVLDAWWAYRSFPVLSDFQSPWEPLRWYTKGARLERQPTGGDSEGWEGRLQVFPHEGANEVILFPILKDWSDYRRLHCTLSFAGAPLRLLISVRDGGKVKAPRRRFDLERDYPAGRHCIVIDLQELTAGERFAPVDISRIQSLHIVVTQMKEPRTLLLEGIYLK
jgi:hypothetical protein